MYLVLAVSFSKAGKYKQALGYIEITHGIVEGMHSSSHHNPRNIDYVLAVNTMTAYLLLKTSKIEEALTCLEYAEKLIFL
mgnify:CR=1 FL=1